MPLVILQGFGPDREIPDNPSQSIVEAFIAQPRHGLNVVPVIWPNSSAVVGADVERLLRLHEPDIWLGLGAATSRRSLSVERRARNRLNFPYPDADGLVTHDTPILQEGPESVDSDIDVDAILRVWKGNGIPGYASTDAGGFMCNMSLYLALNKCRSLGLPTRCGFIHVPYTPAQVVDPENEASVDLDLQIRAVALALTTATGSAPGDR